MWKRQERAFHRLRHDSNRVGRERRVREISLMQLRFDPRGLVAQSIHQHRQARRHFNGFAVEIGAKPFCDFLAERHAMDAADPTVALVRGVGHEIPI
jgi:hypothetical protein